MAALHLPSSSTGRPRLRLPTISYRRSQISLPPSPLLVLSFSLFLCLLCATLAAGNFWGEGVDNMVESQGSDKCKSSGKTENFWAEVVYGKVERQGKPESSEKRKREETEHPNNKKPKVDGQSNGNVDKLFDAAVQVGLEIMGDGEYVLKIKKSFPSSTDENEVERAKQMAQSAGMLLLQAEMLRDMAQKLLAQSQASFQSLFRKPAAPSKSDRLTSHE